MDSMNWLELGGVVLQCAILGSVAWYARKILTVMRGSQEQLGALLKISVSETLAERPSFTQPSAPVTAAPAPPVVTERPVWTPSVAHAETPAATPAFSSHPVMRIEQPAPQQHPLNGWPNLTSTPAVTERQVLSVPAALRNVAPQRRSLSEWLQAPMTAGANSSNKLIQWLVAPTGT